MFEERGKGMKLFSREVGEGTYPNDVWLLGRRKSYS